MAGQDSVHLDQHSLAELHQLGEAYKNGDKALQKRMRQGLQDAGKALGEFVVQEGSAGLPRRGGLAARVAASRTGITAALGGKNVSVSVRIANRQKDALRRYDSGLIRHPVYKTGVWVPQGISADLFANAFKRGAPEATKRVNAAVAQALQDIANDAEH